MTISPRVAELKTFFELHGRWPRQRRSSNAERKLGQWLSTRRAIALRPATSWRPATEVEILALDALVPEWRVPSRLLGTPQEHPRASQNRTWRESLMLAVTFTLDHDRFPTMVSTDPEEKRLGVWLNNQRAALAGGTNAKSFTVERNDQLDTFLPGWASPLDGIWVGRALATQEFFEAHGTWPRSQGADAEEVTLGGWLVRQRFLTLSWERLHWLDENMPHWRVGKRELKNTVALAA